MHFSLAVKCSERELTGGDVGGAEGATLCASRIKKTHSVSS